MTALVGRRSNIAALLSLLISIDTSLRTMASLPDMECGSQRVRPPMTRDTFRHPSTIQPPPTGTCWPPLTCCTLSVWVLGSFERGTAARNMLQPLTCWTSLLIGSDELYTIYLIFQFPVQILLLQRPLCCPWKCSILFYMKMYFLSQYDWQVLSVKGMIRLCNYAFILCYFISNLSQLELLWRFHSNLAWLHYGGVHYNWEILFMQTQPLKRKHEK